VQISVVSDIHGNLDGLAQVADSAKFLIVLGDLLDYVDYQDASAGILGEIFGADAVETFIQLRTAGDFVSLHQYDQDLWRSLADPVVTLEEVVCAQYARAIDLLGTQTLLTLGNVDMERVWSRLAPDHLRCLDGESVVVDGLRFGFVAGGAVKSPPTGSPWQSFDRDPDSYRAAIARIGAFDVLCSHVPPDIHDLRYDTKAQRREMYGPGLLEAIDQNQPPLATFGHIHHPISADLMRGRTRCVNVGYFKRRPVPYILETDAISR
jgi:Icc-related predicted phosphoesterase